MTAIRKSYLIAIEDPNEGFGKGIPTKDQYGNEKWYVVPQGFYMSTTSSTQASSLYGTGAKLRQNSIYGAFQGSWSASWVMDFDHLEFFSIIFDTIDNDVPEPIASGDVTKTNFQTGLTASDGVYEHRFRKLNSKRQRSYVIKERVLNRIAGGKYNKDTVYKGVLARNLQIARSTSGSQMVVEMSGVFADKRISLTDADQGTFFSQIATPLTQYSCMYLGKNEEITDTDAVEQVDSHSINIETGVSLVYSTCSPIATDFFENTTTFAWNATAYMNNPTKKFELLPNSGGTLDPDVGGSVSFTDPDNGRKYSLQPMGKNLRPLEWVNFITYDESVRDSYQQDYDGSIMDAYGASEHTVRIQAKNSTVKSTTTPKGDGSKLQDSLSSVECDEIVISIRNKRPTIWSDQDLFGASGAVTPVDEVTYRQPVITSITKAPVDFKIPVSGYSGIVLGNVVIDQSEETITTISLDGIGDAQGYTDLTGFVVVEETDMFNVDPSNSYAEDTTGYRLDNLVSKQLSNAGAGLSGLTVQTAKIQTAGAGTDSIEDDTYIICPQISGKPSVMRTDYYFIVKDNGNGTATTGYLRVTVR